MKNSMANILKIRFRVIGAILLLAGLFWLGFQWITQNGPNDNSFSHHPAAASSGQNSAPPGILKATPLPEMLPQKIPKDYNPGDTLLDLKIERDRERSQDIESIKELLDKVGLTDKVRQEAEQELWRLTAVVAQEHELENLLKAKGFRDCLVSIGQQLATIVVGQKLQPEEVRNIGEIMAEGSALRMDQIRIMERL